MDELPTMNTTTQTVLWNGNEYNIAQLHKVLKRDEKAMSYKRKAVEKYRRTAKGKERQKEANLRFRTKNKENVIPTPPNSPISKL
jgi:hypothetical protein